MLPANDSAATDAVVVEALPLGSPQPESGSTAGATADSTVVHELPHTPIVPADAEIASFASVGLGVPPSSFAPLETTEEQAAPSAAAPSAQLHSASQPTSPGSTVASDDATAAVGTGFLSVPAIAASPFVALAPTASVRFVDFPRVAHSFPMVMQQVSHGLENLRTIAIFIQHICTAKNHLAADLLKTSSTFSTAATASAAVARAVGHQPIGQLLAQMLPSPSAKTSSSGGHSFASGPNVSVSSSDLGEDAMTSSSQIWSELREQLFEEARCAEEFSAKVTDEIVNPLFSFYTDAEKKRRLLQAHHAALSGQMKQLTDQLLQAKIATVKQVQALQAQEQRERDASAAAGTDTDIVSPPPPSKLGAKGSSKEDSASKNTTRRALASVGSFFKSALQSSKSSAASSSSNAPNENGSSSVAPVAMGLAGGESSEELREKAYAAALSYRLAVSSSNARQQQFYIQDLPNLFSELQRLEIARLNAAKYYVGLFAAANLSLVSPHKQRLQSLMSSVATMHSERDCRAFTEQVIAQVGEVVQPNEYKYDLAWSPEDIRGGRIEDVTSTAVPVAVASGTASSGASTTPSSSAPASEGHAHFFGASLDAQMDLQEQRGLNARGEYDVPIVLHTLVEAIRARKGFNRSSLFFLACDRAQVDMLREQLESGDFTNAVQHAGLDVLANTLKLWLRMLPTPLLPSALYAAAISAIRKDEAARVAERHQQHEATLEAAAAATAAASAGSTPALDGSERTKNAGAAAAATTPTVEPNSNPNAAGSSATVLPSLPPLQMPALPSAQLSAYIMSIFSALPTLNQRVITVLANLLSDIATPVAMVLPPATGNGNGSASTAKEEAHLDPMRWATNLARCAAIFAPVVLRNPHADTTELLLNAPKETRFVGALFITIAQLSNPSVRVAVAPPSSASSEAPSPVGVAVALATDATLNSQLYQVTPVPTPSPSPTARHASNADVAALDEIPPEETLDAIEDEQANDASVPTNEAAQASPASSDEAEDL